MLVAKCQGLKANCQLLTAIPAGWLLAAELPKPLNDFAVNPHVLELQVMDVLDDASLGHSIELAISQRHIFDWRIFEALQVDGIFRLL
jgi:hypothetical protein